MKKLLTFIIFCVLCSCSAKVKVAPDFAPESLRSLAVLPVEYNSRIQREKIDALRDAVESELKNNGFIVLADAAIREGCSSAACPEKTEIASRYLVDGFVTLNIESVSRANFLAGYYNAISGDLIISDKNGKELVNVKDTESERGGLLFNTGQLVQGLISQIENTEEASFNKLSGKFAESLVSSIPKAKKASINDDAIAVNIEAVSLKTIKPQTFEICAMATPDSMLNVLFGKFRTNLREVSMGRYCGVYFLDQSVDMGTTIKVEARSPFGNSIRKDLSSINNLEVCDLQNNVLLKREKNHNKIELVCTDTGLKQLSGQSSCQEKLVQCPKHQFLIYRSSNDVGPFTRAASIKGTSWKDPSTSEAYYSVIAVNDAGVWSAPVEAKEEEPAKK